MNNNKKPKRKHPKAYLNDGHPRYYDKPFNHERPRLASSALIAFYREEKAKASEDIDDLMKSVPLFDRLTFYTEGVAA